MPVLTPQTEGGAERGGSRRAFHRHRAVFPTSCAVVLQAFLALALGSCSRTQPSAHPPLATVTADAGPRPLTSDTWDYAVTVSPGARELSVEARFPSGSGTELGLDDEAS